MYKPGIENKVTSIVKEVYLGFDWLTMLKFHVPMRKCSESDYLGDCSECVDI